MKRSEIIARLKEMGIYKKWVRNMVYNGNLHSDFVWLLNKGYSWFIFLACSFGWGLTPEGHNYWAKIGLKGKEADNVHKD